MKIGGNTDAVIQVKDDGYINSIGERVPAWVGALSFIGWLDLSSGDSPSMSYNAKIQESTHIFVCNYQKLEYAQQKEIIKITPENSRVIIEKEVYEVLIYDDPLNMHEHLEIYLKYTGAQV